MRRERAATIMELVITTTILVTVGALFFGGFTQISALQSEALFPAMAQSQAVNMINAIATDFRHAYYYSGSPVVSATSTSAQMYTNSGGTWVRWMLTAGNIQKTYAGNVTTPYTGATLSLTYYKSTTPYTNSLTSFTPASGTYSQIIAVGITGSITQNGYTETYSTTVRLRNCPAKTIPFS